MRHVHRKPSTSCYCWCFPFSQLLTLVIFFQAFIFVACPNISFSNRRTYRRNQSMPASAGGHGGGKIDRRNPQKNTKFQAPRPRPYWQCRLPRSPNDWVPAGSPESFVSPVFNIDHFLTNPPPMTLGSHVFLRFFLCKGLLRDYGVFFLRSYFFGGYP